MASDTGRINSLGVGSGVLTSDLIDKLRGAEEAGIIKPIENKIERQNQKVAAFDLLDSLVTSFKTSVSALNSSNLYQNRSVNVSNTSIEVSALAGTNIDDFSLDTVALAKKDISQSGAFSSATADVATSSGTLTLSLAGGTSFDVDYDSNTNLTELAQLINNEAGTSITASVVQTGDTEFSLVLASKETGADQAISVSDSPTIPFFGLKSQLYNDFTFSSGFTTNQAASDSEFVYNGITINRSTNSIDDLIIGVTIDLKEEGTSSQVKITQDTEVIAQEIALFVENYNNLATNIDDMTLADRATSKAGIFNGDSFIKSIGRDITKIIESVNENNDAIVNYGIEIDRNGFMSFDSEKFNEKIASDPQSLETFFVGESDPITFEYSGGIFSDLKTQLNTYTKYQGLFDIFGKGLENTNKTLSEQFDRQTTLLDSRYSTLTKQFIAYDAIISKINSQFSALKQIISAEANGNN